VVSGVRPSSAAATSAVSNASNDFNAVAVSCVSAPGDGRTPLNRYGGEGQGEGGLPSGIVAASSGHSSSALAGSSAGAAAGAASGTTTGAAAVRADVARGQARSPNNARCSACAGWLAGHCKLAAFWILAASWFGQKQRG
jgi:hypothetical protein